MVGLAMFLFVGVEFVTPLASELREPARTIPRAMFLGLTAVAVLMVLYGVGVLRQVENVELERRRAAVRDPAADPRVRRDGHGHLRSLVARASPCCSRPPPRSTPCSPASRASCTAWRRTPPSPPIFGWLHPRYKTPWAGIALAVVIPAAHAICDPGRHRLDHRAHPGRRVRVAVRLHPRQRLGDAVACPPARPAASVPHPVVPGAADPGQRSACSSPSGTSPRPGSPAARCTCASSACWPLCAAFAVWQTLVKTKKPLFEPVEPEDFVREETGVA